MPEPAQLKTVAPPNRTNQEITAVLEKFAAQPDSPDAVTRRRMLDVLDDMAEEMIGRGRPEDVVIKEQIRAHCDRLRGSAG